jgi:hypothetical protein
MSFRMKLTPGRHVWIACEVKPGPFPDERFVRISGGPIEWVGFVTVGALKEPIENGQSFVDAVVVDVLDGTFLAKPPGDGLGSSLLRLPTSKAEEGGLIAS